MRVRGLAVLSLICVSMPLGGAASASTAMQAQSSPHDAASSIRSLNAHRADESLPPLPEQEHLTEVAVRHAFRMAAEARMFHNDNLSEEVEGEHSVGENVGIGYSQESIDEALWLSDTHRRAILAEWDAVGVGSVISQGEYYVVQVFAVWDLSSRRTRAGEVEYEEPPTQPERSRTKTNRGTSPPAPPAAPSSSGSSSSAPGPTASPTASASPTAANSKGRPVSKTDSSRTEAHSTRSMKVGTGAKPAKGGKQNLGAIGQTRAGGSGANLAGSRSELGPEIANSSGFQRLVRTAKAILAGFHIGHDRAVVIEAVGAPKPAWSVLLSA